MLENLTNDDADRRASFSAGMTTARFLVLTFMNTMRKRYRTHEREYLVVEETPELIFSSVIRGRIPIASRCSGKAFMPLTSLTLWVRSSSGGFPQERNGEFVVTRDGKSFSGALHGTIHYILGGAVMLKKVKVGRAESRQFLPAVTDG